MSRVARPARFLLFFLPLFVLFAEVTPEMSEAAKRKLDRIARASLENGETIVLSEDELNSFLHHHGRTGIPPGVEDVTVRLREGGATVEAVVDPETVGRLTREDTPLALRLLLRGVRNVSADIDYEARGRSAVAKVAAVRLDGFVLSGAALDWFLKAFAPEPLQPYISGRPIPFEGGLDAVRIVPGRIVFTAE